MKLWANSQASIRKRFDELYDCDEDIAKDTTISSIPGVCTSADSRHSSNDNQTTNSNTSSDSGESSISSSYHNYDSGTRWRVQDASSAISVRQRTVAE